MAYDVMLDLETFGTGPTASIIQIGAVEFDPMRRGVFRRRFAADIMLQSCLVQGCTIDLETIKWWRDQGLARLKQRNAVNLGAALQSFLKWWKNAECGTTGPGVEPVNVWGNGSVFDVSIMEYSFYVCGLKAPWGYRNVQDLRTLKRNALFRGMPETPKREPMHIGVIDAEDQCHDYWDYMKWVAPPGNAGWFDGARPQRRTEALT